jgi:hypothetical protein
MRYVAVLECPVAGLAECAKCFTSDLCRIADLDGRWVLESSTFNACSAPVDVFPVADEILSVVRRILSLYSGLSYALTVKSIQCVEDDGRFCGIAIRGSFTIIIMSGTAMAELATLTKGKPLATLIFERSVNNTDVHEALKLFKDLEPMWADVYDIIEFLGGPREIGRSGWGDEKEARAIKRTANYYRHLGSRKASLLPRNPPALVAASLFAKRALSLWIESRL